MGRIQNVVLVGEGARLPTSMADEHATAEMSTRIERTLRGVFRAKHLAGDAWQLTAGAEGSAEIYLSGVDSDAFAVLDRTTPSAVTVTWSAAGATVTLISPQATTPIRARTATIHEPRPELYQGLPLVVMDDAAKRFWRRVFLLARIPGGRRLLRWIAERSREG
jgi:hypothetical protein